MGPVVSEKKIFEFFSHSKSMETINPRGVAKFDPRGMNGTPIKTGTQLIFPVLRIGDFFCVFLRYQIVINCVFFIF